MEFIWKAGVLREIAHGGARLEVVEHAAQPAGEHDLGARLEHGRRGRLLRERRAGGEDQQGDREGRLHDR